MLNNGQTFRTQSCLQCERERETKKSKPGKLNCYQKRKCKQIKKREGKSCLNRCHQIDVHDAHIFFRQIRIHKDNQKYARIQGKVAYHRAEKKQSNLHRNGLSQTIYLKPNRIVNSHKHKC